MPIYKSIFFTTLLQHFQHLPKPFLNSPLTDLISLDPYWFRWFAAMHGPVQMIGLHWNIDCENLYCTTITQAWEPVSASIAFFMLTIIKAHKNYTVRQTPASLHLQINTSLVSLSPLFKRGMKLFPSQSHSSLSNLSDVEKNAWPAMYLFIYLLNPLLLKSSDERSVCFYLSSWKICCQDFYSMVDFS